MPRVFSSRYGPTYSSSLWEWDILPDPPSSLLPSFLTTITAATPATPSGPPWGVRHSFMLTAARAARVPLVQWHYPCAPHPNDAAWPLVKCASSRRRVSTHRILIVCYYCCCCCCHAACLGFKLLFSLSLFLPLPVASSLPTRAHLLTAFSPFFSLRLCARYPSRLTDCTVYFPIEAHAARHGPIVQAQRTTQSRKGKKNERNFLSRHFSLKFFSHTS